MTQFETIRAAWALARRFRSEERGAITTLSLFLIIFMFMLVGLAIDVANAISARQQLQIAADTAAHAALFQRDRYDANTAKARAIEIARANMPNSRYGDIIRPTDIDFGIYDEATHTFSVDNTSQKAARVNAFRISQRSNAVSNYILQILGLDEFDIVTSAIFETFRPTCFREGLAADGIVDVQSNNGYSNGFCIHSNTHVSVNSGNTWEAGTIVSMPNMEDIELPRSGYVTNNGLYQARRSGEYNMLLLNRLNDILAGMTDQNSRYFRRAYVVNATPVTVIRMQNMNVTDFRARRVNVMDCGGSNVTLRAGVYSEMVIIGLDCNFGLANGVKLTNMTLITTATGNRAIDSPQGLIVGEDDNCLPGGGAEVISFGGIRVAAALEMYGSQLLAAGPIYFQANADGIQGASIVSGKWIEGNSNTNFAFCGTGMDNVFEAEYFRMRG